MYHTLNKAEPSQYANIKQNQIHGVEVRDDMFSIATTNMILRGDGCLLYTSIAESYCKKMSCKHLMLMLQTVKQPENGGAGYVLVVVMDGAVSYTHLTMSDFRLTLIPQHYYKLNFLSTSATKSCSGFCPVRIFTYLSVAKKTRESDDRHGEDTN